MALYADKERGRYPVWQSLDHEDFFPGSGIVFVTVTVRRTNAPPTAQSAHAIASSPARAGAQGDYSLRIEALPDEQVQDEVLGVLRAMFPNATVPAPTAFYFPRWNADPLFRGSYSNWPASFLSEHQANLRANVHERLWFAGEATSPKHFGELFPS